MIQTLDLEGDMANLNLGNVLQQVENIRGSRLQNQLSQQTFDTNVLAQRGSNRFNELLQGFVGGDTDSNALIAADPARAKQFFSIQQQQQDIQKQEALVSVNAAKSVLVSKSPKALVKSAFPQFIPTLQEQGINIDDLTDDQVRSMAQEIVMKLGPVAGVDVAQLAIAEEERGIKSEDVKAKLTQKQFDNIDKLVKGAKADKRVDNFIQVISSMDRIKAAAKDSTGASDLSMIFSFMKMLDPGSVVRESEFQLASDTAGAPEFVRAAANKLITGERLTDVSRGNFIKEANKIFKRSKATAENVIKPIVARAKRFKLRGETIREEIFGIAKDNLLAKLPEGTVDIGNNQFRLPDGTIVEPE